MTDYAFFGQEIGEAFEEKQLYDVLSELKALAEGNSMSVQEFNIALNFIEDEIGEKVIPALERMRIDFNRDDVEERFGSLKVSYNALIKEIKLIADHKR